MDVQVGVNSMHGVARAYAAPERMFSHLDHIESYTATYYKFGQNFRPFEVVTPNDHTDQIPKIIHFCWLGPHEMPTHMQKWVSDCRKLHEPEWIVKVWVDDEIGVFKKNIPGDWQKTWDEAMAGKHYAIQSDIYRYLMLYVYGGVYFDTDMEPVKPLTGLFQHRNAFYVADERDGIPGTAFLASVPGHPLCRVALDTIPGRFGKFDFRVNVESGPLMLVEAIKAWGQQPVMLPQVYFYASPHKEPALPASAYKDAYAVHRWEHSWSPTYTNKKRKPVFL